MPGRVRADLVNHIRVVDPELFSVMEQLCMEYSLQSGKTIAGITFLRPADPKVRGKIFKLAKSNNLEDVYRATYMLNAMIITNYIPTYREFHSCKDNIVNRLNQKINVNKVGTSRVDFNGESDSETYAVIDTKFKDKSSSPKYSLYTLYGELPIDGEIIKNDKRVRKGRRGRKSKNTQKEEELQLTTKIINETLEKRQYILASTAGEYYEILCAAQSPDNKDKALQDPYLIKSLSILMFAKKNYPNLYLQLLARTSLEKSDLFIYLQHDGDNFLIPPNVLDEWNYGDVDLSGMSVEKAYTTVCNDIDNVLYENSETRIDALDNIDGERDDIRNTLIDYTRLKGVYNNLLKYIPENVLSSYTVEQKMWEDDFRMSCWAIFEDVEAAAIDEGRNPRYTLEDALGKLNESMSGPYESRMHILIGDKHVVKDIPVFVDSVYFMYVPVFDIEEDMDLNAIDFIQSHFEEDEIFAGNIGSSEDVINSMSDVILGSNLSNTQILNALNIIMAKKRAKTLTKEEEWKLNEIMAISFDNERSS